MKNTEFDFELYAKGIHITDGNENFILGYGEKPNAKYAYAEEFAELEGGKLPTVSQLRIVARHRDEINNALRKTGFMPIGNCWFWSDETLWWADDFAYIVSTGDGNADYDRMCRVNSARAVINL